MSSTVFDLLMLPPCGTSQCVDKLSGSSCVASADPLFQNIKQAGWKRRINPYVEEGELEVRLFTPSLLTHTHMKRTHSPSQLKRNAQQTMEKCARARLCVCVCLGRLVHVAPPYRLLSLHHPSGMAEGTYQTNLGSNPGDVFQETTFVLVASA